MANSDKQRLLLECTELHELAGRVRDLLLVPLSEVNGRVRIYRFKERIKPIKNIFLKIVRKQEQRSQNKSQRSVEDKDLVPVATDDQVSFYTPANISDAWGCRYVTLFDDQIALVLEHLLETINSLNNNNAVLSIQLIELTIYASSGSDQAQWLSRKVIDTYNKSASALKNVSQPLVPDVRTKKGYSSVHLVFSLPIISDFPDYDSNTIALEKRNGQEQRRKEAKFEIQIRDVLEEGWSESEHFIFYSQKDIVNEQDKNVISRIETIKTMIDMSREYLDTLRSHVRTLRDAYDAIYASQKNIDLDRKSLSSPVDDCKSILNGLQNQDILEEKKNKIIRIYRLIEEAQSPSAINVENIFSKVANLLISLREDMTEKERGALAVGSNRYREVSYYLDLELANAWTFSQLDNDMAGALNLYRELLNRYPKDPVVRYRFARAIARNAIKNDNIVADADYVRDLVKDVPQLVEADPETDLGIGCKYCALFYRVLFTTMLLLKRRILLKLMNISTIFEKLPIVACSEFDCGET